MHKGSECGRIMMHGGEGMEYWRLNNNGEGGGGGVSVKH